MAICQTTRQAIAWYPHAGHWDEVDPGSGPWPQHVCQPVVTVAVEVLADSGLWPCCVPDCTQAAVFRVGNVGTCLHHLGTAVYARHLVTVPEAPRALPPVPADFPVQPLTRDQVATAQDAVLCQTCNRWWDDAVITSWTPAPAGRCPFEYFH